MIYKLNGEVFNITKEQTIGDVVYPRGWFADASNRLALGITEEASPTPTVEQIVAAQIQSYINKAPDLILQIKVANVLAGITDLQSLELFRDFGYILNILREGAYPTAIAAIDSVIIPQNSFMTAQLLASWRALVVAAL